MFETTIQLVSGRVKLYTYEPVNDKKNTIISQGLNLSNSNANGSMVLNIGVQKGTNILLPSV